MNLTAIETASRQAWPALQEQLCPFGVLRFAQGVSRRVNSLNIFTGVKTDFEEMRKTTECFFRARELPVIVRVLDGSAMGLNESRLLDQFLEDHEYEAFAPTRVMCCDLSQLHTGNYAYRSLSAQETDMQSWLLGWHALLGKPDAERAIHHAMLTHIFQPHQFLVRREDGRGAQSCGMAVCSGELVGLFGIATDARHRGQGYASDLVLQLMHWGISQGARFAYLQVEAANHPALSVYRKLGFREVYSYWYREKLVNKNGPGGR